MPAVDMKAIIITAVGLGAAYYVYKNVIAPGYFGAALLRSAGRIAKKAVTPNF
jgi:hypothetical protein